VRPPAASVGTPPPPAASLKYAANIAASSVADMRMTCHHVTGCAFGKRVFSTDIIVQTLPWLLSEGSHGEICSPPAVGISEKYSILLHLGRLPALAAVDIAAAPVAATGLQQLELEETAAPLLTLRGFAGGAAAGQRGSSAHHQNL